MKIRFLPFPALCIIVAVTSCSDTLEEYSSGRNELSITTQTKTLKLAEEYDRGSFLIKFETAPDNEVFEELRAKGVSSVSKVFHSTLGKEAVEARYGLDRWYIARLNEGEDLDMAVVTAARMGQVEVVEYSSIYKNDTDIVFPAYENVSTKATSAVINDPYFTDQWHYRNGGGAIYGKGAVKGADVNVYEVWNTLKMFGDPSIVVAVIDEGVKYNHPDLVANMWKNTKEIPDNGKDDDGNGYIDDIYGYNFKDDGPITWGLGKDSGHGTHCAGTIAAVNNNGIGVAGIAGGSGAGDGCRIMSCQIFSKTGGASSYDIGPAIKYAADNGASIISCSFGVTARYQSDNAYYSSGSSIEIDAIHYFEDSDNSNNDVLNGNIAIFAAGNEAHPYAHYPGAWVDVISVSAIAADMLPTNYTNYGPGCSIAAPGGEIGLVDSFKSMVLSTLPSEVLESYAYDGTLGQSDYGYMQGTSMACPHVSGVVALGLSYAKRIGKKFDRNEFKQLILSSTNDIDQLIGVTKEKTYVWVPISGSNYGYKASTPLALAPFYHQMGTGAIDAWQLMMQIEGIPTLVAKLDETKPIDLTPYFGTSSVSLTYLSVDVPNATAESLGLMPVKGEPTSKYPVVSSSNDLAYIQFGRLHIHPTKVGSGKINIRFVGGGDHLGGGNNPTGGMEISQDVSIISREMKSSNGGWL